MNTGGRFFTAADKAFCIFGMLFGKHRHEFTAVVDNDMRFELKDAANMFIILFFGCAEKCMNIHPVLDKCGTNVVLC